MLSSHLHTQRCYHQEKSRRYLMDRRVLGSGIGMAVVMRRGISATNRNRVRNSGASGRVVILNVLS